MLYVYRHEKSFTWGIAIWEGLIAYLMFAQFLKTNARPLHGFEWASFCGGSNGITIPMGFPTASRDWHPFQRSPPFIQSKAPKTG
jgi:hypothetical protein